MRSCSSSAPRPLAPARSSAIGRSGWWPRRAPRPTWACTPWTSPTGVRRRALGTDSPRDLLKLKMLFCALCTPARGRAVVDVRARRPAGAPARGPANAPVPGAAQQPVCIPPDDLGWAARRGRGRVRRAGRRRAVPRARSRRGQVLCSRVPQRDVVAPADLPRLQHAARRRQKLAAAAHRQSGGTHRAAVYRPHGPP